MFELARRYIKTGFIFFIAGLLLGLYMIVNRYIFGNWPPPLLITAHTHVLLFGFIISLIMGVAIWMFPRSRDEQDYSPKLAEVTYWFLTLGTAIRFMGEVISAYMAVKIFVWLVVLGSVSQVAAGFLFIYNMWSRVRPVGKQT
ncbi:MAG TPA: cbb3-type cytochrome c oxidase subunit I [Thermodesulfobacteriota bacterium]|nr:cbb3-type cytochrome c oxidase subunit I [Thermodesulfobacteriota bacterium]